MSRRPFRPAARRGAVTLLLLLATSPLAAQVVPSVGRDTRALYLTEASTRIGEALRTWAGALNAGDAARAARIAAIDVHVQWGGGRTLRGRAALAAEYAKLKGRIQGVEVERVDVVQSGELAFVSGRLKYEVVATGGGTYQRETLVGLAFHEARDGWRLVSQVGGDFPPVVAVARPLAVRRPGTSDSVEIRVTDAGGEPLRGVRVHFAVLAGGGAVSQPAALTDDRGMARVAFSTGGEPGRNVLQATAAVLEEEPLLLEAVTAAEAPAR